VSRAPLDKLHAYKRRAGETRRAPDDDPLNFLRRHDEYDGS
jgi:hypothetical protein